MRMNPESFNFSFQTGAASPGDSARLIARPCDTFPLGDDDYWVRPLQAARPLALHRSAVEALMLCDAFRSLSGHVEAIAARHPGWRSNPAGLHRVLEGLRASGLLARSDDVAEALDAGRTWTGEPLDTLFVRTCNRPEALARLLRNLVQRSPRGLDRVVVIDDARDDAGSQAAARELAAAGHAAPFAIRHAPRGVRRALAASLGGTAASTAALETYLIGDDDERPTHGAAFNTALLLGAGRRFAVIDDDATLSAFAAPEAGDASTRFSPGHRRRFLLDDSDAALRRVCAELDDDPFARHAYALGRPIGSLAGERFLDDLDASALARLSARSRVRMTLNGTLGEPGTMDRIAVLTGESNDLARAVRAGGSFRSRLRDGRLALHARAPTASTEMAVMATTLTGLDGRELLPPTLPAGRGEDLLLGAALAFVHPGCLFLDLPFMLAHRPDEPANADRGEIAVTRRPGAAAVITRLIESQPDPVGGADPGRRLETLAALLGELGEADDGSVSELIRAETTEARAGLIAALRANQPATRDSESASRALAQAIDAQQRFDEADRDHCRALADPLRRFARFSAGALDTWHRAWRQSAEASVDELVAEVTPAR